VGILGLGNIGRAIADNLGEAGFEVTAVRRPSASDFPRLADSAAELARTSSTRTSNTSTPNVGGWASRRR